MRQQCRHKVIFRALIMLCLLIVETIHAEDGEDAPKARWFKIEMLIFSHGESADVGEAENVRNELEFPRGLPGQRFQAWPTPKKTRNIGSQAARGVGWQQLTMKSLAEKLRTNNKTILAHLGWKQPTVNYQNASHIYIKSSLDVQGEGGAAQEEGDSFMDDPTGVPQSGSIPRVEGYVRLSVERYLHLKLDLRLNELTFEGVQPYPLQQIRRLRSREIHYFDHPKYGVIVKVLPM